MNKKLAIIGFSAQTREIIPRLKEEYDIFLNTEELKIKPSKYLLLNNFDPAKYKALVTIGDPICRFNIVNALPKETEYYTFIDESVKILDPLTVHIGNGSIICAGTILTTNITIGMHSHINLNNTICHDCNIGDFFTTAPGVNISGTTNIGSNVYIGTNSSIKQKISICDNVTIGMNSGVNKNITISGTYVNTPIKFLKEGNKVF
jgi:sugar O-acyltransferase (sialic acid O-acetyltransferase NeuD family)